MSYRFFHIVSLTEAMYGHACKVRKLEFPTLPLNHLYIQQWVLKITDVANSEDPKCIL
jgi:hypothetical protein